MRAGVKTESVVAAAADLANRNGWSEVTLANVAGLLGIKTPSLYNHISGLDDLRQKLAVHAFRQLYDRMLGAAVGQSGTEAFLSVGDAYVGFAREQPGLYEATYRIGAAQPPEFEEIAVRILQLLYRLLEPFRLDEEQSVHAVRGLRSMLHGFATLEATGGFQMLVDRDASLHYIIGRYMEGIQHR